jgi:DNA-binding LytR/AlgR family response regulator
MSHRRWLNSIVRQITYHRDGKEYFFEPQKILFFEADDDNTYAHTASHFYKVRHRLYQLEGILPEDFLRASKSAIVNTHLILSFSSTVGTTGRVEFYGARKTLHISRKYIKPLKTKLQERSQTYENNN